MTNEQIELKSCPFCGGEASIEQTGKKELTLRCVGVQPSGLRGCGPQLVQKVTRQPLDWLAGIMAETWNRRALEAAQPAGAVTVKALAWKELYPGTFWPKTWHGVGVNTTYKVEQAFSGHAWFAVGTYFDDLDEAKAAAQADYEQRILAALEHAAPAAEPVGVHKLAEYWSKQAGQANLANHLKELADIEDMLNEGQGDDNGMQIMPDFDPSITTLAKVEACLFLLEKRRDVIEATLAAKPVKVTDAAVSSLMEFICQDVLPSYDIDPRIPQQDVELPNACRLALEAALAAPKHGGDQ